MKKYLILILFLAFAFSLSAQTSDTGGGEWTDPNTWVGSVAPADPVVTDITISSYVTSNVDIAFATPGNPKNDFIVDVGGLYDILDFGDNGEIAFATVKFLEAYKNGNKVTIVGLNIKTGKLLKRSHCYNDDAQACNWVLTDLFTNPENNNESKSNRHEVIQ